MSTNVNTTITPESMKQTFISYEKELRQIPMFTLEKAMPYLHVIPGVRYKHTMSEIQASMELGPWNPLRKSDNSVKVNVRTLETYLGNNVVPFDPTSDVYQSIWGSAQVQRGLQGLPFTYAVWQALLASLGNSFYKNLFTAERDATGNTTATLFDGFKTIADKEIADGNISAANGNYLEVDAIDKTNAVDVLEAVYDAMDEQLKEQNTVMLVSPSVKRAYELCYRDTFSTLAYNREFKKTFIEGSENKCEIAALSCVPAGFIQVTVPNNACIGLATEGEKATFDVLPSNDSHFYLDFVASMFFGCQYRSIQKEFLLIAKTAEASTTSNG